MINYWLDKINNEKEIIKKLNKILEEDAEKKKEEPWELDL